MEGVVDMQRFSYSEGATSFKLGTILCFFLPTLFP
jgi:hypothetical protein